MVHKKGKSKRVSLKTKHMVDKKVKEFKRKMRKEAKNNPNARKSVKKDPGIPNLWPFKEQLIRKFADDKEKAEIMKQQQKERRKAQVERLRKAAAKELDVDSKETVNKFEMKTEGEKDYQSRRWYFRELNKVINQADVILEVVDARDPMGCRCVDIERRIQAMQGSEEAGSASTPKKLIIIINKIDLVPVEVVQKWVKHFRREFPTIAFKASTQQQATNLKQSNIQVSKATGDTKIDMAAAIGGGALMSLLKNYARSYGTKKAITVGIVGYPNVGKSSIINSLKRSRAVVTGATPGVTKALQTIRLDSNISLLDSPGVLFAEGATQAELVLRNCLKLEDVQDPVAAVHKIVEKAPAEHLMQLYSIAEFGSPDEFISHVAHKRGKLGKGGVPNTEAAAVTIIKDWTSGFIPFYTTPPEVVATAHDTKAVMAGFSKEFDINALLRSADEEVKVLEKPSQKGRDFISMDANAPFKMQEEEEEEAGDDNEDLDDDDEDGEGMSDEEEEENIGFDMSKANKKGKKVVNKVVTSSEVIGEENQRNKNIKKNQKKERKDAKKQGGDSEMADEPYNFETDFN